MKGERTLHDLDVSSLSTYQSWQVLDLPSPETLSDRVGSSLPHDTVPTELEP